MTVDHFEASLKDKKSPIAINCTADKPVLLVSFGGIYGGLGMPLFEFFKVTAGYQVKKIFVRDLEQAWYHRGLQGLTQGIHETTEYFQRIIEEQNVKHTVLIGNSMGGYAALLFGWLLEVNEVHAFSPQTFIDKRNRVIYFDLRWRRQIKRVHNSPDAIQKYFDLSQALQPSNHKTQYHLYYNAIHILDNIHARRMRNLPNTILHPAYKGGHKLVRYMRDSGSLKDVLSSSLSIS